jgi:hypothetical protein
VNLGGIAASSIREWQACAVVAQAPFSTGHFDTFVGFSWHSGFAVPQLAPPLAQANSLFAFGLGRLNAHSCLVGIPIARSHPGVPQLGLAPVSWGA